MSTSLDTEVLAGLEKRRGDWPRLADAAGVSHSWISQFVRGKIPNPGFTTLKKLNAALLGSGQEGQGGDSHAAQCAAASTARTSPSGAGV